MPEAWIFFSFRIAAFGVLPMMNCLPNDAIWLRISAAPAVARRLSGSRSSPHWSSPGSRCAAGLKYACACRITEALSVRPGNTSTNRNKAVRNCASSVAQFISFPV